MSDDLKVLGDLLRLIKRDVMRTKSDTTAQFDDERNEIIEILDRLQGEAGYATGGYVDRLVFSGLDVHEMLNEIEEAICEKFKYHNLTNPEKEKK